MMRIAMAAVVSVLLLGACKGPFGPNTTTYDPKLGIYVENTPADSSAASVTSVPQGQQPYAFDDDN